MRYFGKFGIAAAVMLGLTATSAFAADIIEVPVDPQPVPAFGGWYLRGHIGMSNQRLGELEYFRMADLGESHGWYDDGGFDSAPIFSVGAGYQFNDWFRADATVEYRGKSDFSALDYITDGPGGAVIATNDYTAKKSEWLLMANAYVDLGTFSGITPYVGAGIGASRNTISHFNDRNIMAGGGGWAGSDSEWNFAWALHAGLGIQATDRLTIDLGYSYVDLGDAKTGTAYNYDGSTSNEAFKFNDLTSHDVKLGMRYAFN
ncbi:MAG: outer membrane protein [Phyllobacterium sp.]